MCLHISCVNLWTTQVTHLFTLVLVVFYWLAINTVLAKGEWLQIPQLNNGGDSSLPFSNSSQIQNTDCQSRPLQLKPCPFHFFFSSGRLV